VREMLADAEADEARKGTVRAIRGNTDRYLTQGARALSKPVEDADQFAAFVHGQREVNEALQWALEQFSFEDYETLRRLHSECDLNVPGFGAVIGYHAVPGNDEAYLTPDTPADEAADFLLDREGRLAIGGHIHVQMDRALPGGWRAINVGSVGMSFDQPGFAEWGLFTFEGGDVHVDLRAVPYDLEGVIASYGEVGFPSPGWVEQRLRQLP